MIIYMQTTLKLIGETQGEKGLEFLNELPIEVINKEDLVYIRIPTV